MPNAKRNTMSRRTVATTGSIIRSESHPGRAAWRVGIGPFNTFQFCQRRLRVANRSTSPSTRPGQSTIEERSRMARRFEGREFDEVPSSGQAAQRGFLHDLGVDEIPWVPRCEGRGCEDGLLPAIQEVAIVRHPGGQELPRVHEALRRVVLVPGALDIARGHPLAAL